MEFVMEIVDNFTNTTIENEYYYAITPVYISFVVLLLIVCLVGLFVDVITVYMVFRFNKLKTVPNIIIANWAIADIYSLISTPMDYLAYPFIEYNTIASDIIGYLLELTFLFYSAILCFSALLATDWCLSSYFIKASERFRKYYKFPLSAVWIFVVITAFSTLVLRIQNLYLMFSVLFFFFMYIVLSFFVIVLHIVRRVEHCRGTSSNYPTLALTVTTVCLLLYAERWISLGMTDIIEKYFPFFRLVGYVSFIAVFIILYRNNADFQACFRQVWKRSDDRYVDEIPDYEGSPRNTNSVNQATQVHFHRNADVP